MKTAAYQIMYRLGFKPWDNGVVPPEIEALAEGPDALPAGKALDLGCGTGTQAIYLARHGWQVTGVDAVAGPLEEAQRKAAAAGVQASWVHGDITRLADLGIGSDFDFILDLACFHGLPAADRPDTARQITAVSRRSATFLLGAFAPGHRGPLPSGIGRDEIARLFGADWQILWQRRAPDSPVPAFLKRADPTWYCLRRN
jgi:SAM-dependent methyltransferase